MPSAPNAELLWPRKPPLFAGSDQSVARCAGAALPNSGILCSLAMSLRKDFKRSFHASAALDSWNVKVTLAAIAGRSPEKGLDSLTAAYLVRLAQYTETANKLFRSEEDFLGAMDRLRGRTAPFLVLLDSRGKMLSSEELAARIRTSRDSGLQNLVFAVGPADGWSESSRNQAGLLLSLGRMTLPHELARLVVAEQIYRAFTILAGHPYHCGH